MTSNNTERKILISVTPKTIFKILIATSVTVIFILFLKSVVHYLFLIVLAGIVALALNPYVNWLQKSFNHRRFISVILAYLSLLLIIGGLLAAFAPTIENQAVDFIDNVPQTLQSLKTDSNSLARLARWTKVTNKIDEFNQDFSTRTRNIISFAIDVASRVANAVVSIITVVVLSFMMLLEGPKWGKSFWRWQKKPFRERYLPLAEQMYTVVTGYLDGQILMSLTASVLSFVILQALGIANAAALATLVFLAGLIPLIGLPLVAIVITIIALISGTDKAIIVAVFYILFIQIQSRWIKPYVQPEDSDMTPLTVFLAAVVGFAAAGYMGAVLAIPLAGCARILLLDFLDRRLIKS